MVSEVVVCRKSLSYKPVTNSNNFRSQRRPSWWAKSCFWCTKCGFRWYVAMAHVFGSSLGLQIWDYVDRILIIQDIWGQDFKARAVHLQQKASEQEVLNYVYPVALPNYSNLARFLQGNLNIWISKRRFHYIMFPLWVGSTWTPQSSRWFQSSCQNSLASQHHLSLKRVVLLINPNTFYTPET